MTDDEHVDSLCNECRSPLVQLEGDWYCTECGDGDDFQLVPNQEEFVL